MVGFTDKPTEKIVNDLFVLENYISGLGNFILECSTPMTIAIQGDWGSGKTSMMNMIREKLSDKVVPVWFNTWQFSQFNTGDQLPIFFMSSLIEAFDIKDDKSEGIKKNLYMLGNLAKNVAVFATDTFVGGKAADAIEDGINKVSGKQEGVNVAKKIGQIKKQFQECVDISLKEHKKDRIVIFVDDLDRLQPSKAVELLEVLKLFLDCDNCVFVLAIDYEVVSQGIKQKFGDLINEEKSRSFFDKIIQVPFKMPVAQYDVYRYVQGMLKEIGIESNDEDLGLYVSIIKSSIGCNPRSMKRLFNTYLLLTKIAKEGTWDNEWNKKVLFGVLCLQLSFEKVYNYIAGNRNSITDSFIFALSDKEKFEAYHDVNLLKKEFGLFSDDDTNRLIGFMKNFNKIIDKDRNQDLSEDEIDDFIRVLTFSTITSAAKEQVQEDDADRWNYRRLNRKIVKAVNSRLKDAKDLDFSVYQSNADAGEWKFYFASGYMTFWKNGVSVNLDYRVKTDLTTQKSGIEIKVIPKRIDGVSEFAVLEPYNLEKDLEFIRTDNNYIRNYPMEYVDSDEFNDLIFQELGKIISVLEIVS